METEKIIIPRFASSWNYRPTFFRGERNNGKTQTVPDLNLSIEQILQNYSRGVSMDQWQKVSIGYDDPDFGDLDPTQRPDFDIIEAKDLIDQTTARLDKAKAEKQLKLDEIEKAKNELWKQEQEKIKTPPPPPPTPTPAPTE